MVYRKGKTCKRTLFYFPALGHWPVPENKSETDFNANSCEHIKYVDERPRDPGTKSSRDQETDWGPRDQDTKRTRTQRPRDQTPRDQETKRQRVQETRSTRPHETNTTRDKMVMRQKRDETSARRDKPTRDKNGGGRVTKA